MRSKLRVERRNDGQTSERDENGEKGKNILASRNTARGCSSCS